MGDQHIANALEFIGNNCDQDNNGGISWDEAASCFTEVFGNDIHDDIVEYAQKLFGIVDHDGNGEITFINSLRFINEKKNFLKCTEEGFIVCDSQSGEKKI